MKRTRLTPLVVAFAAVAIGSVLTALVVISSASQQSTAVSLSAQSRAKGSSLGGSVANSTGAAPTSSAVKPSPSGATSAAPPAAVAAAPIQVLMIGDSIMKGFGLSPTESWPGLVSNANNWKLTTLACDGAGFVAPGNPSECGGSFVDVSRSAATLNPDLIIIEGSSNDFGQPNSELLSATVDALAILRSEFPSVEIIGLSTVWSESDPPAQLADVNSQVEQAVTAVGGYYLDIGQPLGGHPELMQDDDVHPSTAGQKVLAAAIQSAIASVT